MTKKPTYEELEHRVRELEKSEAERMQAEEELKTKMKQLEMTNDIMVGRELTLNETRKEVNKLLIENGREEKYKTI